MMDSLDPRKGLFEPISFDGAKVVQVVGGRLPKAHLYVLHLPWWQYMYVCLYVGPASKIPKLIHYLFVVQGPYTYLRHR